MFVAQIVVEVDLPLPMEEACELVDGLLVAWWRHGQILRNDYSHAVSGRTIVTTVTVPKSDSLDARFNNGNASEALALLSASGCRLQPVRVLGEDVSKMPACACHSPSAYILFSSRSSPVSCGDCQRAVALYELPSDDYDEYLDLLSWATYYDACDTLQLGCLTLEQEAMQEMSSLDSSLTQRGLQLCETIEERTGKPCYYYLFHFSEEDRQQQSLRKCPSCGDDWLLNEPWHKFYDFRCDQCRLLSNVYGC